ncbi:hypothetical protein [Actinoplanes sp. NPDC049599]|uniref:hypothetical protein n=1 Tax=Actinoplanes sp. NPDC049599 TaxID=3363903 RepID=UPI00378C5171
MNTEERLAVALHVVADTADTPPAPVADLIRRGRRRRRAQRLTRTMMVVGVVAVVSGTTALTVSALRPAPAPVAAAPVDVASGAEATSATSFRFQHTGSTADGRAVACHGAVDPGAGVGWEQGTGADRYEIRFVNATQYVKPAGKPWRAEHRATLAQSMSCPGPIAEFTVDPAAVVRSLKERGRVEYTGRTGSGQDAVDVYTYTYSVKGGLLTYSGGIEAGVASRHVQKVTLNLSGDGANNNFTTLYSGFGEPVRVTVPKI